MYIIVNGTPINIYYSSLSKVIENKVDNVRSALDSVINPQGSGQYVNDSSKRLGRIIASRGWVKFEEIEEYSLEGSDVFMQVTNTKYKHYRAIMKEGYFFFIVDNMNFVVSQLYPTQEEAEKSINAIIEKMNEMTSKDIKFNI